MKHSIKKFIIIYISIGMVWALTTRFPFGIMLDDYKGKHEYWNRITAVTNSFIDNSGDLVLCLQGRLAFSQGYPTEITKFSLTIPIEKIKSQKMFQSELLNIPSSESTALLIKDELINKSKCINNQLKPHVLIKTANYTPRQAYNFYSVRNLKEMKPDNGNDYMMFVVPTANSYDKVNFLEAVDVFIIFKNKDVSGRHYYAVDIQPTIIDRTISLGERAIAFVKDTFFYPIAIFMMGGWGH